MMTGRSPVVGDLLEEYREVVRPSRGRIDAAIWLAAQFASLVRPWMWGLMLGVTLGALNLISTAVAPLAEDTPMQTIAFGVAVLGSWAITGFAAERRHRRFRDAIAAGIVVATVSASIVSTANLARKVVFIDTIRNRSDWRGLLLRFDASGMHDLRTFVIDEELRGLPAGFLASAALGALFGGLGGAYSMWRREAPRMDVT